MTIMGFLLAIFPSNICPAMRRIDVGGHSAGPRDLLVRAPLQVLLMLWIYWFVIRGNS